MRRSARALSVAVLAGAALGIAGPAALAEPAAEVSPSSAVPGGSVTVSVSCDPTGGAAPATMDAASEAFEAGTVRLRLVSGNEDEIVGPAYSGTARIGPADTLEGEVEGVGSDSAWTVDGTCPAAPGGQGKQWSATFTVARAGTQPCAESHTESCASAHPCTESHAGTCPSTRPCAEPHADSCGGAVVPRGVQAGEGGSFTDSVPALVAGGVLIAGACAGAVYRLRRGKPTADV
ncbi:hypothetical protein [Streptomyces resistomycificus]|uniref:Uncharacterized protein n=1 Tax=Streptomyces resistomycificus TaxID=67356 RepID=A0A0L8LY39_9ACTN|nr:hypothetical protein [Streptomyces resistomycificus]KOG43093.1 hypothetical protein ADK37_03365 [Streptomyces resistomycificus]KUO01380.1 hypothetical protein AQJ84_02715 [Streptomyces resistomycificus]